MAWRDEKEHQTGTATKNDSFRFIGHYACLDFINTEEKKSGKPFDLLRNFDDFVSWLASGKSFEHGELVRAVENWSSGQDYERTFEEALALRKGLGELATETVEGRSISRRAVGALNRLIAIPLGTTKLVKTPRGFEPLPLPALLARLMLIHDYRRIILRDPMLPPQLLPGDWIGREAYSLAGSLYHALAKSAEAWIDEHLHDDRGALPQPRDAFSKRFP